MKQITIDNELCEGCGACEQNLPGIHRAVAAWDGRLLANERRADFAIDRVVTAERHCPTGAFKMEDVK